MPPSPKEIRCYQLLVKKQLEHFRTSQNANITEYLVYTLNPSNKIPTEIDKTSLGYKYTLHDITKDQELSSCVDILQGLISKGVLIELSKIDNAPIYTTLHGDIAFRVIRGRAYEDDLDGRWVGHYIIEYEESRLPNFNAAKLEKLKELLAKFFKGWGIDDNKSTTAAEAIVEGLEKAGFKSLALWQYKAIESILLEAEDYYVVDAPTATGKTLVFMVPAIAYALLNKLHYTSNDVSEDSKTGALLVYPRKSLQKQQLEILLKILHHVNTNLRQKLNIVLTVAIDKGVAGSQEYDKKEIAEIELGNNLQGKLVQVRTKKGNNIQLETFLDLGNNQTISIPYFKGMVLHSQDRDFILSQEPDILITNPWAIRERIKSSKLSFRSAYTERRFIVFDEAHVYININYLDLVAALKLYRHIMTSKARNGLKFVLSSATIPLKDKRELAQWILGLCKDDNCSSYDIDLNKVSLLDYDRLEPDNPNKVLKVIVTLLPYRLSIETLVQGVIQILVTALMHKQLKAIIFVDSISEVSTLMKYIDTIFHYREGMEICDHILATTCRHSKGVTINTNIIRRVLDTKPDTYDDYSWSHFIPTSDLINKHVDNLLSRIQSAADIIKEHHGALNDDVRRAIEQGFTKGSYKVLLATSTLDLGVNFDDVTFIVQYKEPISDEALIQRVGRAGRKDESFKIAMAFYIPTYTPMLIQTLVSQQTITQSSFSPQSIPLPHPAIIHKMFKVETLEYDIKLQRLFEYIIASGGTLKPQDLRRIVLNNIIDTLTKEFNTTYKALWTSIPLLSLSILNNIRSSIKNVIDSQKLVKEKAESLPKVCKPRSDSVIGATLANIVDKYARDWIKKLISIFDEYAELGVGLALLTPDEAKEQLNKFMRKIGNWVDKKPQVIFTDNQAMFLLPASEIQQPVINLYKIQNPQKCRENINDFSKAIDSLVSSVNQLIDLLSKSSDIRSFIVALLRPSLKYRHINVVTQNNFEAIWHRNGLGEYVLELIRILIGMVPHYEVDRIELEIR